MKFLFLGKSLDILESYKLRLGFIYDIESEMKRYVEKPGSTT